MSDETCNGAWVSGSGGHREHEPCGALASWHVPGLYHYCDEHICDMDIDNAYMQVHADAEPEASKLSVRIRELEQANQAIGDAQALHPDGHCGCHGEGTCQWCKLQEARERVAELELQNERRELCEELNQWQGGRIEVLEREREVMRALLHGDECMTLVYGPFGEENGDVDHMCLSDTVWATSKSTYCAKHLPDDERDGAVKL